MKYKYIILAPEVFHLSVSDLISDGRKEMEDIVQVVNKVNLNKDECLIKYRTLQQFKMFPTKHKYKIGYGTLLDYCTKDSIVIGYPGSAMVECLNNGISFFSYYNYEKYTLNPNMNKLLIQPLYIAKNKEELLDNILHKRIFRSRYSKDDLINNNGDFLHEAVSNILSKKDCL